jgi:hypothetical protein
LFTVKNTLAGAVLSGLGLVAALFVPPPTAALPAWLAVVHVWFLLGHMRLKDRAKSAAL